MKEKLKIKRIIYLEKFIKALKNKKYNNKIQLEVEGKFLKIANQLIIKKLVVPKKLLNNLGMEKMMIDGPNTKNPLKKSVKDMISDLGVNINKKIDEVDSRLNKRLDIIEKDINIIKSLPTIQKEIQTQKDNK